MKETSAPRHPTRSRLLWTAAIAVAAVAVLVASERHGLSARTPFPAPPGLAGRPVAAVGNAAEAFVVWRGSGLRGRRLVLLTGQWGAAPSSSLGAAGVPGVTADRAPYWAARLGLTRALDVVMPQTEFVERRAADGSHREFRPEADAYRHDIHGYWLRISSPAGFAPPAEPAIVLVEPTWFRPGAPPDPLAWLSARGVRADLALVALDDPSATEADRAAAARYVAASRIPRLEIELTP